MASAKVTSRATSTKIGPSQMVAAPQRRAHPLGIGAEGHQRRVLEHERDAQHQQDLHLVGRVHDAVHEQALGDPAHRKSAPAQATKPR